MRLPAVRAAITLALTLVTAFVGLIFLGKNPFEPAGSREAGTVFYVVPYHYGFALYDAALREVETMEVKEGEVVTLHIVPALALAEETFFQYAERTLRQAIGGLAPGDPQIRKKIVEDLELGNLEHIVGISAHPVYVTTDVAAVLDGRRFRPGAPQTLAEAARRKDPTIKTVTFTAKRVGAFDVLCVDSGMEGGATCGWGHKWMVGKGALVVRR